MDAPLALYRRYRPDTFADMIGQDHVTAPLSQALANNRTNHAYLFSGPRGCGKTTSARIMARALNCEQGPTPVPCGVCDSCVDLSTGGNGSIDVIEIDAASHGGVDDARDLRERAFFSPVKSRYKVYIIDEAHMVSKEGFNALLKLVEEPPSHLRFIFATTEPEKVIGTIKSRTHHYPFRLVAPKVLGDYVVELCSREGVAIEPTVVPLIVRAGGGSVRDSLSVLDQLIGGSGAEGVTYALTTALLGYTPDSLLDETVDALAADDGASLFAVVDKVIEAGQDPRRFAEDLLHRLRDLVVISAVPDAATRGIIEVSGDQADRLTGQAARFGRAELTRAADIVSQGLTDMRGATAPRLLLEIMCARILLPGFDQTAEGLGARVDRVERRLSVVGDSSGTTTSRPPSRTGPAEAAPTTPTAAPATSADQPTVAWPASNESAARSPSPATTSSKATGGQLARVPSADQDPPGAGRPAGPPPDPQSDPQSEPARQRGAPTTGPPVAVAAAGKPSSGLALVDVRRLWPGVLDRVKSMRRFSWLLLSQNAQVKDLHDGVITIGFVNAGAAKNFRTSGADEILRQALIDELGVDWRVEGIFDGPGSAPGAGAGAGGTTSPDRPSAAAAVPAAGPTAAPTDVRAEARSEADPLSPPSGPASVSDPASASHPASAEDPKSPFDEASTAAVPNAAPDAEPATSPAGEATAAAKKAIRPTRTRRGPTPTETPPDESAEVSEDDTVIDDAALSSHELLARELGAQVIEDVRSDTSDSTAG